MAINLSRICEEEQRDVFIDCPTLTESEAVVVAESLMVDSPYHMSTLGCIVREEDEPAVFRTFRTGEVTSNVEARIFSSEIEDVIIQDVQPIKNGEEDIIGVLIFEHPVENMCETRESALICENFIGLESLKKYVWITEYYDDATLIVSDNDVVLFCNNAAKELYRKQGYMSEILGKEYKYISLHGNIHHTYEKSYERDMKIGAYYYHIKQKYLEKDQVYLIVLRDITDLKLKNNELLANAAVIKEIHHRIKNNIQTVLSLLRLQKRRTESEEVKEALGDAMSRIQSIATTHEILLNQGVNTISLFYILEELKKQFVLTGQNEQKLIDIIIKGYDHEINSDLASSVVLVVSELFQNSIKYAFLNQREGQISIHISDINMGYVMVTVSDNGKGFKRKNKEEGLGLKIIDNLIKYKLKGRWEVQSDENGTITKFDFRLK